MRGNYVFFYAFKTQAVKQHHHQLANKPWAGIDCALPRQEWIEASCWLHYFALCTISFLSRSQSSIPPSHETSILMCVNIVIFAFHLQANQRCFSPAIVFFSNTNRNPQNWVIDPLNHQFSIIVQWVFMGFPLVFHGFPIDSLTDLR